MATVKLTVVESRCRCGTCKTGDEWIVKDVCPPLCHELWHVAYPSVYVLLNGGCLDYGEIRAKRFDVSCPDEGRVLLHGEVMWEEST